MPDEAEAHGLLALMLLLHARRAARFVDGEIVLLAEQDRSRYDHGEIAEGRAVLQRARTSSRPGAYVLQAEIASLHAYASPDWLRISTLYADLHRLTGSPVVELNRAVAVAETDGPAVALGLVEALALEDYRYWHATRGELLRRLGRVDEARAALTQARSLTTDDAERRLLERRLAELEERSP